MYETREELDWMQALLDRSFGEAGGHLVSIMTPDKRLNARQIARYLQGTKHIALATVSSRHEPRVSPVDGLFLHGRFHFGTGATALRTRHLRRNAAASLVHMVGEQIAIIVHGTATIVEPTDREAREIDKVWQEIYGFSALDPAVWQSQDLSPEIVFARVEPRTMLAYAPEPSGYPE